MSLFWGWGVVVVGVGGVPDDEDEVGLFVVVVVFVGAGADFGSKGEWVIWRTGMIPGVNGGGGLDAVGIFFVAGDERVMLMAHSYLEVYVIVSINDGGWVVQVV